MKVTIIGGGGRVGSCAAFALQCGGLVAEIQILDAYQEMAEGEALDLLHGSAFASDQKIYAGDYARAADSDLFLITAGLRRKADESRLDLINRNVALFTQILESIKSAGLRKDAHVFVVSNPVDILTRLAVQRLGRPWQQVMLPVWSSATVNGLPLAGLAECTPGFQNAVFERTRGSGAEVIKKKGGAGWAVGIAIRDVIHAVLLNKRALLPVSSLIQGAYGLRDICLSVPSVVGRPGVEKHVEIKLWPKEQMALQQSAKALKETLGKVGVYP